jgi:hypothetical protein
MPATRATTGNFKRMLGTVIIGLGILILVPRLSALPPRFEETTEALKAELYNALPAIGLGLLHAGQALAFEPRSFFAGVLGILVSFWPLLLVAVGTLLLRNGFGGEINASSGSLNSPAKEEL